MLECSYDTFLQAAERATDLDDVIAAHHSFLTTITERALLGSAAQPLLSQLRSICDLVLRFEAAQAALCAVAVEEVAARSRSAARAYGARLAV